MTTTSLPLRRALTMVGVLLALLLGFGTIRATAAWTAASAPLTVAPVSVSALQDQLATEQARSDALRAQLSALMAQTADLSAALDAADARIASDATAAARLAKDLKAARKRLATLEAAIAAARR